MSLRIDIPGAEPLRAGACQVIAEAGANHNNSVDRAIEMAARARRAGAWAIKFQLYRADTIAVPASPKYWTDSIGTATQYEAFTLSDQLDYREYGRVAQACRDLGILFFATPFDLDAVEALEGMGAPLYKLASGDITHRELIEAVAATGKPVMLSTGAAEIDEIRRAIGWANLPPERLVVLLCTLTYPTPDTDAHCARLPTLAAELAPYLVGVSDHTLGIAGGWMTAALGGVCIEKHYTIDKRLPDVPDHAISVDADELGQLVAACRRGATLRGSPELAVLPSELPAREGARRSVVLEREVGGGTVLTRADIGFKRPGTGIEPWRAGEVIGRVAARSMPRGTVLSFADLRPA